MLKLAYVFKTLPFCIYIFALLQPNFFQLKAEDKNKGNNDSYSKDHKRKKCRKSESKSIFDNFESGCLGIACSTEKECGPKMEFEKNKTFLSIVSCRGEEYHGSSFSGTWRLQSGKLIAISTGVVSKEEFCENECEEGKKCIKACETAFVKKHGKASIIETYTYELVDRGSNRIFMKLINRKSNSRIEKNKLGSPAREAEWEELGCMY